MTLCKPFIEKCILLFYDRVFIDTIKPNFNLQEKERLHQGLNQLSIKI